MRPCSEKLCSSITVNSFQAVILPGSEQMATEFLSKLKIYSMKRLQLLETSAYPDIQTHSLHPRTTSKTSKTRF